MNGEKCVKMTTCSAIFAVVDGGRVETFHLETMGGKTKIMQDGCVC